MWEPHRVFLGHQQPSAEPLCLVRLGFLRNHRPEQQPTSPHMVKQLILRLLCTEQSISDNRDCGENQEQRYWNGLRNS